MGRPPRAASAATKHVGFRLTEDEERRLDELVEEQGHKDRSALLRAWLAQAGPRPAQHEGARSSSAAATEPVDASELSPHVCELVYAELRCAEDVRLGLIHVPSVARALGARVPLEQLHAVLLALAERGTLELRPEAGSEFLSSNDAALCPPGPRGTFYSYARWNEHGTKL